MARAFQDNDLEALLAEYQQAKYFLRHYPHILEAILDQITTLQAKSPTRSLQEVEYEINRADLQQLIGNPSLAFYIEPVCPECGTALVTDPADANKSICPECSEVLKPPE